MSHITKIKTKIKNLITLKKTLDELDINYNDDINNIKVKSWNNKKIEGEFVLEITTGTPYNIGVVLDAKSNTYEFVADWWGIETYTGLNQEQYMSKISQKYAYSTIMDKVNEKGYNLISENTDEKGNIKLVLRKW